MELSATPSPRPSASAPPASSRCAAGSSRSARHPSEPRAYLRAVTLGPHLDRLPAKLREPFVEAIAAAMGEPLVLDYVRLNIDARRPA